MSSAAPMYLEVLIKGSDHSELRTLRVPVTAETTVRQLAQECLSRFVKQTRFGSAIEVAVDDVCVTGCSLFYNDPVGAVVRPTEKVTVRLQNVAAADVAPRRLAVESGDASQVSPAEMPSDNAAPSVQRAAVAQVRPAAAATSATRNDERGAAQLGGASAVQLATAKMPAGKRPRSPAPTPATEAAPARQQPRVDPLVAAARQGDLAWGSNAHKNFAANYVSDPDKLARLMKQQKQQREAAATKAAEEDVTIVAVRGPQSASSGGGATKPAAAGASQSLRTLAASRPTSNPIDKSLLVVPAATKTAPVAPPLIATKTVEEYRPMNVARQLDFFE
jgi:hypothetical protein